MEIRQYKFNAQLDNSRVSQFITLEFSDFYTNEDIERIVHDVYTKWLMNQVQWDYTLISKV